MRLEKASGKAIKYACLNFHYSKAIPYASTGYSIFNEKNEWCGVVIFNRGNINAGKTYNCKIGEISELIRVALNGKQGQTSKAVSLAIKLFKKDNPLCKLLISYADTGQDHKGIIYQAMNWYYEGEIKPTRPKFKDKNGKIIHSRVAAKLKTSKKIENYDDIYIRIANTNKHRYTYPLDKSLIPLCKSLSKPYPKQAVEVHKLNSSNTFEKVGGANPTQPLK
jgi:hypothetical protein